MKDSIFWDIKLCGPVKVNRRNTKRYISEDRNIHKRKIFRGKERDVTERTLFHTATKFMIYINHLLFSGPQSKRSD